MTTQTAQVFSGPKEVTTFTTDSTNEVLSFNGALDDIISVPGNPYKALWITATVRGSGQLNVTVAYTDLTLETFPVIAGCPLLVETKVGTVGQAVASVSIVPVGKVNTTVSVTESNRPVSDAAPGGEMVLALIGSAGVVESGGTVTSWTDLRPDTSMPQAFTGTGPTFNQFDSDFNNRPTLTFNGVDEFLQYTGNLTDQDEFVNKGSICIVYKSAGTTDCSMFSTIGGGNESGARASLSRESVTGIRFQSGDAGTSIVHTRETVAMPSVLIANYEIDEEPTNGRWNYNIGVYTQGFNQFSGGASIPEPTGVTSLLATIANDPGGAAFFKGTIAEIRVYKEQFTTEEREQYINYAKVLYGLTDEEFAFPFSFNQSLNLDARRGVVDTVGDVDVWTDTRGGGESFTPSIGVGDNAPTLAVDTNGVPYLAFDAATRTRLYDATVSSKWDDLTGNDDFTIAFVAANEAVGATEGDVGNIFNTVGDSQVEGRDDLLNANIGYRYEGAWRAEGGADSIDNPGVGVVLSDTTLTSGPRVVIVTFNSFGEVTVHTGATSKTQSISGASQWPLSPTDTAFVGGATIDGVTDEERFFTGKLYRVQIDNIVWTPTEIEAFQRMALKNWGAA